MSLGPPSNDVASSDAGTQRVHEWRSDFGPPPFNFSGDRLTLMMAAKASTRVPNDQIKVKDPACTPAPVSPGQLARTFYHAWDCVCCLKQ
jgi:hypothetical protein